MKLIQDEIENKELRMQFGSNYLIYHIGSVKFV